MPICITCSTPVKHLYTTYSKADDRTLGKGVRLTQCPNCKRFADKYVEHDYVVLFIDLVLIKPQVYRHLLFNRLGRTDDKLDPSILRLGTLLVLFDVYITWARIERSNSNSPSINAARTGLEDAPIITQYLFFLTLNVLATLAQHITIRLLARVLLANNANQNIAFWSHSPPQVYATRDAGRNVPTTQSPQMSSQPSPVIPSPEKKTTYTVGPGQASPSAISTALLVSSCTKLFPILLVIWPTTTDTGSGIGANSSIAASTTSFTSRASSYIGWVVLFNNIEALVTLLDCGYLITTGLAVAGMTARWIVEGLILGMVGLSRDDNGAIGDCMSLLRGIKKSIERT